MKMAVKIYSNWGAHGKVKQLCIDHPELASIEYKKSTSSQSMSAQTLTEISKESIDLAAIMKATHAISKEIVLSSLLKKIMKIMLENAGAVKGFYFQKEEGSWVISVVSDMSSGKVKSITETEQLKEYKILPTKLLNYVYRSAEPLVLLNAIEDSEFNDDQYIALHKTKSVLCMPVLSHEKIDDVLFFENNQLKGFFTEDRVGVLQMLGTQAAISLENARFFSKMQTLYRSTERFVPKEFLKLLHKKTIEEVKLGDSVEMEISALFSDIRQYTTITEKQTPEESAAFINEYLSFMAPIIRKHHGFINQFHGDAIMALFPKSATSAVDAAVDMSEALGRFNKHIEAKGIDNVNIGIGINTGKAMILTMGEEERMDANVISDAINTAARLEGLNKMYGTRLLISDATYEKLTNKDSLLVRQIDRVRVKGRTKPITIYQIFGKSTHPKAKEFNIIKDAYQQALNLYQAGEFTQAKKEFQNILKINSDDKPSLRLLQNIEQLSNQAYQMIGMALLI